MMQSDKFIDNILSNHQKYVMLWCIVLVVDLFMLLYMIVYFLDHLFQRIPIEWMSIAIFFAHMMLFCILIGLAVYDKRVIDKKQVALQSDRLLEELEKNQIYQLQLHEKIMLMQKEEAEFKNHIATITTLMQNGKTSEIANYIDTRNPASPVITIQKFTGKAMIDLMFAEKLQMAANDNIQLEIDYQPDVRVHDLSEYDMSILFSNLLDNALKSASLSEERTVSCEVRRKNAYMDLIVITNSCDNAPLMWQGLPISFRSEELHGYGTKIIQKKVEAYHGHLRYEYDEEKRKFFAYVLLSIT